MKNKKNKKRSSQEFKSKYPKKIPSNDYFPFLFSNNI